MLPLPLGLGLYSSQGPETSLPPGPQKCGQGCWRDLGSSSCCPASRSESQTGRPVGQMWFALQPTFKTQE